MFVIRALTRREDPMSKVVDEHLEIIGSDRADNSPSLRDVMLGTRQRHVVVRNRRNKSEGKTREREEVK